jgi:CRISPR-associated protein Csm5
VVGRGEKPWQAPNYDLFRALHVADSAPGAREWLGISNVVVWPTGTKGIPIDVETIQPECTFTASLTIDTYLFSEQAQQLKLGPKRGLLENLAATCREHAQARIAHEQAFFQQHREQAPQRFYTELAAQLAACDSMSFLLQLGWGAGWGSKTVEQTLRASEGAVAAAVRRYRLDRGKGRGREFPATRHLVTARQRVVEPLGWVHVEMKERTG